MLADSSYKWVTDQILFSIQSLKNKDLHISKKNESATPDGNIVQCEMVLFAQ